MRKKISGILVAFGLLAGCAGDGPYETIGTFSGAAVGGLLGSQVGSGTGQLASVAVGTLAGAAAGGSVGQSMDKVEELSAAPVAGGDLYGDHYRRGPAVLGSAREHYRDRAYDAPEFFSQGDCGRLYENEYRERNEGGRYYRDRRWQNDEMRSTRCYSPPAFIDGKRDGGRGRLRSRMERWPDYGRSKRFYYYDRW